MKKLFILILLLALIGGVSWGAGVWITGQTLHDMWKDLHKTPEEMLALPEYGIDSRSTVSNDIGRYIGFVIAIAQLGSDPKNHFFSIPASATFAQVLEVVGVYLDAHPEEWNLSADTMVVEALARVWPYQR